MIPLFPDRNTPDERLKLLRESEEERSILAGRILAQLTIRTNTVRWHCIWSRDGRTLIVWGQLPRMITGGEQMIEDAVLAEMDDLEMVVNYLASSVTPDYVISLERGL